MFNKLTTLFVVSLAATTTFAAPVTTQQLATSEKTTRGLTSGGPGGLDSFLGGGTLSGSDTSEGFSSSVTGLLTGAVAGTAGSMARQLSGGTLGGVLGGTLGGTLGGALGSAPGGTLGGTLGTAESEISHVASGLHV